MKLAKESAVYLQELATLAADLAEAGVMVDECHAHFAAFGNFTFVARAHHGRWRFTWDARDKELSVEYTDESQHQRASPVVNRTISIPTVSEARAFIRNFPFRSKPSS